MKGKGRYMMTQSLLSAWQYMFDCTEENGEEARKSFLAYLRREPAEPTDAMLRGISFEDAVNGLLSGNETALSEHICRWAKRGGEKEEAACARRVAELVAGGAYQVTAYKDVTVAGEDFKLMAKCDWVKAGVIYDCKRVSHYDVGKYFTSPQHPVYLFVLTDAREFQYIVADGDEVNIETYRREDIPIPVIDLIEMFVAYLKGEPDLWKIYTEKWICG